APPSFYPLYLHDALPILAPLGECRCERVGTRASRPRTAVETALEGDGTLVRAEVEGGIRFVRRIRRRRVDRRVRQAEVDRPGVRSEEHTSELQSPDHLVC